MKSRQGHIMSLLQTLKYWNCTVWYTLPDIVNKINNVPATLIGSDTSYKLSNNDSALYLTGASYIDNICTSLDQNFTISCWFLQTESAVTGSVNTIFSSVNSTGTSAVWIYIDNENYITFLCRQDSNSIIIKPTNVKVINNQFYNITATHTSTSASLYLNGACISSIQSTFTLNTDAQVYKTIGCLAVAHSMKFTGCIKNFFIFNSALSESMIKKLSYLLYIDEQQLFIDTTDIEVIIPEENTYDVHTCTTVYDYSPTITLIPTYDTWIDEGDPDNSYGVDNYGNSPILTVAKGIVPRQMILLQFLICSVPLPVSRALLKLYHILSIDGTNGTYLIKRFDTSINDNTTWNNKPNIIDTNSFSYTMPNTNGWFEIDVTNLINSSGHIFGLLFDAYTTNTSDGIASKDSPFVPTLTITNNSSYIPLNNETNDPNAEYTSDDIQNAINITSPNSIVYLPSGHYTITHPVILKSNVSIQGQDKSNTIIHAASDVCNSESESAYFYGNGVSNITISNLTFQSDSTGPDDNGHGDYRQCIQVRNSNNITVHDCNAVKWIYNDFFKPSFSTNLYMYNCNIVTGHAAFYAYNCYGGNIYNNTIIVYTNAGIRGDTTTYMNWYNNTVLCEADSGQAGFELQNKSTGLNIFKNIIYDFDKSFSGHYVLQNAGNTNGAVTFKDNVYWNSSGGIQYGSQIDNIAEPVNKDIQYWNNLGYGNFN